MRSRRACIATRCRGGNVFALNNQLAVKILRLTQLGRRTPAAHQNMPSWPNGRDIPVPGDNPRPTTRFAPDARGRAKDNPLMIIGKYVECRGVSAWRRTIAAVRYENPADLQAAGQCSSTSTKRVSQAFVWWPSRIR